MYTNKHSTLFATQDSLVSEPIRVMLGGSAANFAVHATTLNKAHQPITATRTLDAPATAVTGALAAEAAAAAEEEAAMTQTVGDSAAQGGVSSQLRRQTCVLHTSVASDDMGDFVRRKLDEHCVEWSQAKERENQARLTMRGWVGMVLTGLSANSLYSPLELLVFKPDYPMWWKTSGTLQVVIDPPHLSLVVATVDGSSSPPFISARVRRHVSSSSTKCSFFL